MADKEPLVIPFAPGPTPAVRTVQVGEPTVWMNFKKRVSLTMDDGSGMMTFEPGVQQVPAKLGDHWYLKVNGAVPWVAPEPKKADARLVVLARDLYASGVLHDFADLVKDVEVLVKQFEAEGVVKGSAPMPPMPADPNAPPPADPPVGEGSGELCPAKNEDDKPCQLEAGHDGDHDYDVNDKPKAKGKGKGK